MIREWLKELHQLGLFRFRLKDRPLACRLLWRAGIPDHVEFGDHQIVLMRGVTGLVIVIARFLGNGAANGHQVTHVWSKGYILASQIP